MIAKELGVPLEISESTRKKLSEANRRRTHSETSKRLISDGMMGNKNHNGRGDRQHFYNGERFDSRWEVWTAEYFDANGIEWKHEEKGFRLSDGRVYYPDFFIYENGQFKKLVEVKGYFREANRKKNDQFKTEYPQIVIEIWDEEVLKVKGILDRSGNKAQV